ncbi:MAG: coproporphyrinogen dehydrogenase HemZ, partial [Clostridia bacterium]
MKLILNNHKSSYQIQSLFQMFYPLLTWKFENKVESSFKALKPLLNIDDEIIITSIFTKKNCCFIIVYIKIENKVYFKRKKLKIGDENYNYWFCNLIYDILSSHTERLLPWGFYTGVRPVKTVNDYLKTNNNNIKKVLIEKYNITDSKMDLAIQTASYQNEILLKQEKEYYSLFIFIPFCPSRCKYCSFVSNSISKTEKIENEYINNLIKELEFTAQNINKTSKIIHTIYVGGGTPTSISDDQLLKLVKKIKELFLKNLNIEYTFEAGRADSITKKKLEILKEYGVNRISINPQTFNDTVLKKIKRNHTSKEVVDTFEIARNVGFNNVNMDFIAGLEDETFQSFQQSLIKGCSLNPENITIHTLAIKKSAQLKQSNKQKQK